MKPTYKHPSLEQALKDIFGIDRVKVISDNVCATCGKPVTRLSFRNELSLKEYRISGMCQTCQDSVFGED